MINKFSYNLPKNWVWTKLKEISFIQGGYAFKSTDYSNSGVPLLRISNIKDCKVNFDQDTVFLDNAFIERCPDFQINKGDILIALSGATTGKFGIYEKGEVALLNQRVGRIKFYKASLDSSRFVFHYMDILRKDILKQAYGAAQPNISTQELGEFSLPLPPLPEQKRIVAKIEELFTKLDTGVEALKEIKKQLKRYRQAVLKYAFEGKLTEKWREANKNKLEPASVLLGKIKKENKTQEKYKEFQPVDTSNLSQLPRNWVWTRVGEIFKVATGSTPDTSVAEHWNNGKIKWATPKDLGKLSSPYIDDTERKITQSGLDSCSAKIVPLNSLLISTRAPIGYIAILADNIAFNQGCKALVNANNNLVFIQYYYYLLLTRVNEMNLLGSGSTFKEISKDSIANITIPFPPIPEQHKIVEEIEKRFSVADKVEKTVDENIKQANRLRQSILKKAFEGKLVPQNPNDEPAEKLLERIKIKKVKQGR
ncbi:MAG: restriction endonuclease subunit S [bacterium]